LNSTLNGRLAQEEFAFRYLFPQDARERWRPLSSLEQCLHFSRRHARVASEPGIDLEPVFRACTFKDAVGGSVRDRLVALVLATHCPATVTPHGYGIHASYPSPRAYYALSFLLVDHDSGTVEWIDTAQLRLRAVPAPPLARACAPAYRFSLWIKVDFEVYDPLYNLFRSSLFALEAGHMVHELIGLGHCFGLRVVPSADDTGIRVDIEEHTSSIEPLALAQHRRFARERNSGRSRIGLFPAWHRLTRDQLDRLADAIRTGVSDAHASFPVTREFPLTAELCLRAGENVAAGIFAVETQGLRLVDSEDPVDACERFYNYREFGFRTVPAVAFLSVAPRAFGSANHDFLQLNMALGFVWQQAIHCLTELGLFGRPFRSYDQVGIDRLLRHGDSRKAYYGLLIGKNRCRPPTGILR